MQNWFVINTKPKKERQVAKLFAEGGFTCYVPVFCQDGRIQPFFPGYGFLRFDFPGDFQTVRYTRGVKRVVGSRESPTPVPDEAVEGIIEVAEGPLKGLRGIFRREIGDNERVMILLNYVSYQGQLLIEKQKLKKIRS